MFFDSLLLVDYCHLCLSGNVAHNPADGQTQYMKGRSM